MPSPFPRIAIVVSDEQHALLAKLGRLQGRSAASYVRTLLDLATPRLRAILEPLERAEEEEEALRDDGFQDYLAEALHDAQDELDEQLDLLASLDVDDPVGALIPADAPPSDERPQGEGGAPAAAGVPPYCNTGVRDPGTGGSNVVRMQRKVR